MTKKAGRLIMISMNKGVHQRKAGFLVQKPASLLMNALTFWSDHDTKGEEAMLREGQVRIPSGCAVSGIFAKDGSVSAEKLLSNPFPLCTTGATAWGALRRLWDLSRI